MDTRACVARDTASTAWRAFSHAGVPTVVEAYVATVHAKVRKDGYCLPVDFHENSGLTPGRSTRSRFPYSFVRGRHD